MAPSRLYFLVSGDVQGVGYRWFALKAARALEVSGWIRNRPDGAVEGEAEGEEGPVKEFIAALSRGPAGARVDKVKTRPEAARGGKDFDIR